MGEGLLAFFLSCDKDGNVLTMTQNGHTMSEIWRLICAGKALRQWEWGSQRMGKAIIVRQCQKVGIR